MFWIGIVGSGGNLVVEAIRFIGSLSAGVGMKNYFRGVG